MADGPPEGDDLRDTYGHSPVAKMFGAADVYGIGYEPRRADRSPLRLGIIGAGGVAQAKYLPAIARLRMLWDPVELVAVADPDMRQGEKVARVHGCRSYAGPDEMLDDEMLDAVIVASPDRLHARHAEAALERGVPVLVEKPFTRTLAGAGRLCERAAPGAPTVMPVANLRFAPPLRRAREITRQLPAFHGAGVLVGRMHLGYDYVELLEGATVHLLDLARYFMGDVRGVVAHGIGRRHGRSPYPFREAAITLELASGSVAQISTSSSALSLKPWLRLEVHGDGAWLAVDDVFELTLYDSELGPTKSWRPVLANTLLADEEFGGHMPQLEHFLQVVRGEEEALLTAGDGYCAVELVVAVHLAIATGERIRLPLDAAAADAELAAVLGRGGGIARSTG